MLFSVGHLENIAGVFKVLEGNWHAWSKKKKAAKKYSQPISRFGQEFEERFGDFYKLESGVPFILNPVMEVDMMQIWATFLRNVLNLNFGQVEMEILTLQNDIQLKALILRGRCYSEN